jgi:aminoglycoside 6'-N-acetyltransferase
VQVELEPFDIRHVVRLRELHQQPGVIKWWGPMEDGFPFDEAESQRFAIVHEGEVVGLIQWGDDSYPEYRHAYVDIFIGDEYVGRGLGTAAMKQLTTRLITEHGYHRIILDPATENGPAIRSYEKAGFRRVGVHRRAHLEHESKQWRDELFMELVVDE